MTKVELYCMFWTAVVLGFTTEGSEGAQFHMGRHIPGTF